MCRIRRWKETHHRIRAENVAGTYTSEDVLTFAKEMLEYLTAPADPSHPSYDWGKDAKRRAIISAASHTKMKRELLFRGIDESGDIEEMMMRAVIHLIDPTAQYSYEDSSMPITHRFITEEDVQAGLVRELTDEEIRLHDETDLGPDCDDMAVFRRKPVFRAASTYQNRSDVITTEADAVPYQVPNSYLVVDELDRKLVRYPSLCVLRNEHLAKRQDFDLQSKRIHPLQAYIAGVKQDFTGQFKRNGASIIIFPDETGWDSKRMRTFADELALHTGSLVMLPDMFRGAIMPPILENETNHTEVVTAWLQGLEYKTIFDDFVAACHYVLNQHQVNSISYVGVGFGGGKILQLANDIYALANHGLYEEILTTQKKAGKEAEKTFKFLLQQKTLQKKLTEFHQFRRPGNRLLHPSTPQAKAKAEKRARKMNKKKEGGKNDIEEEEEEKKDEEETHDGYNYDKVLADVEKIAAEEDRYAREQQMRGVRVERMTGDGEPDLAEDLLDEEDREDNLRPPRPRKKLFEFGKTKPIHDKSPEDILDTPEVNADVDKLFASMFDKKIIEEFKSYETPEDDAPGTYRFGEKCVEKILAMLSITAPIIEPRILLAPEDRVIVPLNETYQFPDQEMESNWAITERLGTYAAKRFRTTTILQSQQQIDNLATQLSPNGIMQSRTNIQKYYSIQLTSKDLRKYIPRCLIGFAPEYFNATLVGKYNYLPTVVFASQHSNTSVTELRQFHDSMATHIADIPEFHVRIFDPLVHKDFMFIADDNLPLAHDIYHHLESICVATRWFSTFSVKDYQKYKGNMEWMKYSKDSFCIQPLVDHVNRDRWANIFPVQEVSSFVHDKERSDKLIRRDDSSSQFPIF